MVSKSIVAGDGVIHFYVSGYAMPDEIGIREYTLDQRTAKYRIVSEFSGLTNPSYVLCHPRARVLYAVEEIASGGKVVALSIEEDGLKTICALSSGGADPCHLSLSPDSRFLFVSNYTSGSLAVLKLDSKGIPEGTSDLIQHEMDNAQRQKGNPSRQERAHIHFSICDGQKVFVNDLGMNAVYIYSWDAEHGKLVDCNERILFPNGSGPRHLVFNRDSRFLYVLCELNARIHVFARDEKNVWRHIQDVSSVSEGFRGFSEFDYSIAAGIRLVNDRTICVSNRGHNSIALFQIAPDGRLHRRQMIPSGGETPRDFQVIDNCMVVANQDSGNVSVFTHNDMGEYILRNQILNIGKPSCICVIPEK